MIRFSQACCEGAVFQSALLAGCKADGALFDDSPTGISGRYYTSQCTIYNHVNCFFISRSSRFEPHKLARLRSEPRCVAVVLPQAVVFRRLPHGRHRAFVLGSVVSFLHKASFPPFSHIFGRYPIVNRIVLLTMHVLCDAGATFAMSKPMGATSPMPTWRI